MCDQSHDENAAVTIVAALEMNHLTYCAYMFATCLLLIGPKLSFQENLVDISAFLSLPVSNLRLKYRGKRCYNINQKNVLGLESVFF